MNLSSHFCSLLRKPHLYDDYKVIHKIHRSKLAIKKTHLVPNRISLTAYGQALMLSVPPVITTPASPTKISWTPLTMDWNPDPQSLLTVNAGISVRNPARSETCLKLN